MRMFIRLLIPNSQEWISGSCMYQLLASTIPFEGCSYYVAFVPSINLTLAKNDGDYKLLTLHCVKDILKMG